jgi:zinc and cadmium transporter
MTLIYALGSVLVVSLVSLVGLFTLSIKEHLLKKYVFIFVSIAVGALLGDAFIHLIPESFEEIANPTLVSVLIIGGILLFFIVEKFLHWHHHELDSENHVMPVGKMILFSDSVHNIVDGIIIGVSYMVSIEVGIATTIAVLLHEIPQEIGDFGVLLHAGYSRAKALLYNFYTALCAIVGLGIAYFLSQYAEAITIWFLPIAAGGFIYIAVADLIPELHKTISSSKKSHALIQIAVVVIGVLAMYALLGLE